MELPTKLKKFSIFTISHLLFRFPHRGFTLIELLITIAIISILVSIGAVSYSNAQRQGRDAERKSNIGTIRSALENSSSDNNTYPLDLNDLVTNGYLNELPADPDSSLYTYNPKNPTGNCLLTPCSNYEIVACLENSNDSDKDATNTCAVSRVSYTKTAND